MRFQITIEVWKKGKWFIAKASELDFVSQGKTFEEAKRNLLEVVKIQFREMGTLEEYLSECGFEIKDDKLIPSTEMIGFEKLEVSAI